MRKYTSTEKKVHIYAIKDKDGKSLDLMNVLVYKNQVLDRVSTFIGYHNRGEYICVGNAEDLSAPGAVFSYSGYVRQQREYLLPMYLEVYHSNLDGKIYDEKGSCHIII